MSTKQPAKQVKGHATGHIEETASHCERADDETMHSNMDDHDRTMLEYLEARGAGRRIWSEEMANKFKSPKRIDLGPFYRSQGADLD